MMPMGENDMNAMNRDLNWHIYAARRAAREERDRQTAARQRATRWITPLLAVLAGTMLWVAGHV